MNKILLSILFVFIGVLHLKASDTIVFSNPDELLNIGQQVYLLEDKTNRLTIEEVVHSKDFVKSEQKVPNLGATSSSIWVRIELKNTTNEKDLVLSVNNPMLNEVALYSKKDGKYSLMNRQGEFQEFSKRRYKDPNYLFDVIIYPNNVKTYYLRINCWENIQLPITFGTVKATLGAFKTKDFVIGAYTGIMLAMILYNLFIYFSVKDKNYLYYVIYIIAVLLTQITFNGYSFKYLWPSSPGFETRSVMLMSVFVGVTSIEFLRVFIDSKKYLPKLDKLFIIAHTIYAIIIILILLELHQVVWGLILSLVMPLSLFMLFTAYKVAYLGYRPAIFFAISWTLFLVGVFIYAMKDFGFFPNNFFTEYTMIFGSAIETILLSFALADRINTLKQEKLAVLEVNQQLVVNQNITLEKKVRERTVEIEMQKKKIETQRLEEVKSLRYKALTAQMNPHFIFNALNSIRSFVLNNDSKQADKFLTKFSKLMRAILDSSREDYRLLSQEIDSLNNYLEIEQLRFENKFEYSITVEESLELEDIKIPSFIVQPYVENAVLHGMLAKESGQIMIDFRLVESKIVCVIEDNGCGRKFTESDEKAHKSVSMSITKERLTAIGDFSSVKIIDLKGIDNKPCGTRVEIAIDLGEGY